MWLTAEQASALSVDQVRWQLQSCIREGISWKEAESRRDILGPNEFVVIEEEPLWKKYIEQFKNPLILLLLASAFVSLLMRQVDDAVSITVSNSVELDSANGVWSNVRITNDVYNR